MNTNNPLELLITAAIDSASSKANLQNQLDDLSKQLKGLDKIKLGIDKSDLESLKEIAKIDFSALKNVGKPVEDSLKGMGNLANVTKDNFNKAFEEIGLSVKRNLSVNPVEDIKKSLQTIDPHALVNVTKETNSLGESVKMLTAVYKEAGIQKRIAFEPVKIDDGANSFTGWIPKTIKETDLNLKEAAQSAENFLSKLQNLQKSGSITNQEFESFTSKINGLENANGFKQINIELDRAVDNNKRIAKEQKEQEQIQDKISKTIASRESAKFKEELDSNKAINKVLDDQYKKYSQISKKIDEYETKSNLSGEQANRFRADLSPTLDINKLKGIESSINKQVTLNKENVAKLKEQEQVQDRIRKLVNGITSAQARDPKNLGNNPEVVGMLRTLNEINPASSNAAKSVKSVSNRFDELKASATVAGRESMGVMESFRVAMEKFPVWMAASTTFYGTVRTMKNTMQEIVELDSQITVFRRVAGDGIDVNEVMKESIRLASELGNTISDVNEGFIAFARQGYRGDDLSFMAEYATLLGNISEMNVEESASILTAALKGFNLEASEAARVVDALNEVDKFIVPHISNNMLNPEYAGKPSHSL